MTIPRYTDLQHPKDLDQHQLERGRPIMGDLLSPCLLPVESQKSCVCLHHVNSATSWDEQP